MKKKSLWRAKLMARMAQDGDVEGLAEIITELMEEPVEPAVPVADPASAPAAVPAAAEPLVAAVVNTVAESLDPAPEAPVVVETPVDQPVLIDCGPEILEALRQIISLLTAGAGADCHPDRPAGDEDPLEAITEAAAAPGEAAAAGVTGAAAMEAAGAAEAATEAAAGTAEAMAEAVQEAVEAALDPVETLVAEILEEEPGAFGETAEGGETGEASPLGIPAPEAAILSTILEPETEGEDEDTEDPDAAHGIGDKARAADALRSALAVFRPQLARMTPAERQRFVSRVGDRMKRLTADSAAAAKPGAYAALRRSTTRDHSDRDLGNKIMQNRNANFRA